MQVSPPERLSGSQSNYVYFYHDGLHPIYVGIGTTRRGVRHLSTKAWAKDKRLCIEVFPVSARPVAFVAEQLLISWWHTKANKNRGTYARITSEQEQEAYSIAKSAFEHLNNLRRSKGEIGYGRNGGVGWATWDPRDGFYDPHHPESTVHTIP